MAAIGMRVVKTLLRRRGFVGGHRSLVYTETGAILPKPEVTRFGVMKMMAAVVPFLYLGATMSKEGAAFLEENDIFVPDDDDDD